MDTQLQRERRDPQPALLPVTLRRTGFKADTTGAAFTRTAAQNSGTTLVLGVPGGFVPLKNGNPASDGEVNEDAGPKA